MVGSFLPPVAQELVELGKAGLVVDAVALEDDGGLLLGVGVVELERAVLGERPAVARWRDEPKQDERPRAARSHAGKRDPPRPPVRPAKRSRPA